MAVDTDYRALQGDPGRGSYQMIKQSGGQSTTHRAVGTGLTMEIAKKVPSLGEAGIHRREDTYPDKYDFVTASFGGTLYGVDAL